MSRESRDERRKREFAELKARTRQSQEQVDLAFKAKGGSRDDAERARRQLEGQVGRNKAERMIRDAASGMGKQSLLKRLLGS